ncbi:Arabinose operon regulatory protein [compost metagenome]
MTPVEYVMKYRLEQAKLLLLKTEWPIAEVAHQVGFENVPYFSNCFTSQIGLSPSKYRKQYTT